MFTSAGTHSGSASTFYSCLVHVPETSYPCSNLETATLSFTSPSFSLSSLLTLSTTGAVSSSTSLPLDSSSPSASDVSDRPPPQTSSIFGPVPDSIRFPKEHAPPGARYCEEVNAFIPADLPYRIRGIKKSRPRLTKDFSGWLKRMGYKAGIRVSPVRFGGRLLYEPLVMAMGVSHGELKLIELKEARRRSEIVYRSIAHLSLNLWDVPAEVDI